MGEPEKTPEKTPPKIEIKKEEEKKPEEKPKEPALKEEGKEDKLEKKGDKKFPLKETQAKPILKLSKKEAQPYSILDVFGGALPALAMDDDIFCAWGRKFFVLDSALSFKNQFLLKSPITRFFVTTKNKQKYLYVFHTEGFTLFSLLKEGPKLVADFDVQAPVFGPYDGVGGGVFIFILLPGEVQVVDITDPQKTDRYISIPETSVQSVFATGSYFYLVNQNTLNIYNWNTFSLASTISFEKNTDVLGVWKDDKKSFLVLGFKNDQGFYTELNLALLSPEGLISQKGETWVLPDPAQKAHFDPERGFLYLATGNTFNIFNLKKNILWEGPRLDLGEIFALSSKKSSVLLSAKDGVHLLNYEVQGTDENEANNLGAPTLKWSEEAFASLPTSPYKIFLFGKSALVASHNSSSSLYLASAWATLPLDFKPVEGFSETEIEGVSVTKMGLLFYDKKSGKFLLLDKTLKNPTFLTLAPQPVSGFAVYDAENGFYLYLASGNESSGYSFSVYFVTSPEKAQKVGEISLPYAGGVALSQRGEKAYVACGLDGVCIIDLKDVKNSKISLLPKINFGPKGSYIADLASSPRAGIGFVFIEKSAESNEPIMYVAKISDNKLEGSRLSVAGLTKEHFRGMTFSKGGEVVIMPGKDGLSFFDITYPEKSKLLNVWSFQNPIQIDVTNKAQTLCSVIKDREVVCVKDAKLK